MKRIGPSITKSRQTPFMDRRLRPLVRCTDYRWRELFESADVVSEGAVRQEGQNATYYGSTSILLSDRSHGGRFADEERAAIHQLLAVDPHARVRAIRMACLEAQLRAKAPIDSIRAELLVGEEARGVRITVDVEARVMDDSEQRITEMRLRDRRR